VSALTIRGVRRVKKYAKILMLKRIIFGLKGLDVWHLGIFGVKGI
jgi:hypothetical protein